MNDPKSTETGPGEQAVKGNDIYANMSSAELRAAASHARHVAASHVREVARLNRDIDECLDLAEALTDRAANMEAAEQAPQDTLE